MKYIIWIIFIALVIGNGFVFVSGIKLSDNINHFEKEISRLHQENNDLEKEIYEVKSLRYTASMAARLNFAESLPPIILDGVKYAFNR